MTPEERIGALTYKYLAMYDGAYAETWLVGEHGADSVKAYEDWLDSHPLDIAPQERGAAIHRANYLYCTYSFGKTKDPKLIKEIIRVSEAMNKSDHALLEYRAVSNEDGGITVEIGDNSG